MQDSAARLAEVLERLHTAASGANRDPSDITLIGASKTVAPERLAGYLGAGLGDAGENYVQEGVAKIQTLGRDAARWHFIGALQSNKAREVVAHFDVLHSLDRVSLARALDRELQKADRTLQVLLQVRIGGEESKSGCDPDNLPALFEACGAFERLQVVGLMALPPSRATPDEARADFRELRELRDGLRQKFGEAASECVHLSMGMSGDFEAAIGEGATMVRLGTALFGRRG